MKKSSLIFYVNPLHNLFRKTAQIAVAISKMYCFFLVKFKVEHSLFL